MDRKDSPIAQIKERLSIVDLVSSYIPLTKAGKNYKGLCPFHGEKTPSFMVSPELGMFRCFGCGLGGDQFEFIQQIEGVGFSEALKILGDKAGVEVKINKRTEGEQQDDKRARLLEINHLAAEFYNYILIKHKIGSTALEYLHKRGITDETIKDFKLGYAPNSWQSGSDFLTKRGKRLEDILTTGLAIQSDSGRTHDRFRGRVMIPFFNLSNEVIGFTGRTVINDEAKYLNSPESPLFSKSTFLYGLNASRLEIKKADLAIVVEGQLDFLAPWQAGFKNIVCSGGTALTAGHLKLLHRYTKNLAFCFDSDKAGDIAARKAIKMAEDSGFNVKLIILPAPYKDPDECVRGDREAFDHAVRNALNAYDFYLQSASKRFNLTDAIGKKEAGEFLLPIIREIRNPIEQSHYLQKVSEMLAVPVDALTRSLQTMQMPKDFESSAGSTTPSTTALTREEFLLSLLLKAPVSEVLTILDDLSSKDFSSQNHGRFDFLKERLLLDPELDVSSLISDSTEPDFWQNLYLADTGDFSLEILMDLVNSLKRDALKREMSALSKQLKQAESASDEEKVSKLQLEFKEISGKLASL